MFFEMWNQLVLYTLSSYQSFVAEISKTAQRLMSTKDPQKLVMRLLEIIESLFEPNVYCTKTIGQHQFFFQFDFFSELSLVNTRIVKNCAMTYGHKGSLQTRDETFDNVNTIIMNIMIQTRLYLYKSRCEYIDISFILYNHFMLCNIQRDITNMAAIWSP